MMRETKAAIVAAKRAGSIAVKSLRKNMAFKEKSSHSDLVTKTDVLVENAIVSFLSKKFPDYGFLAEESGETGVADCKWIVDPIDGTNNFIAGIPYFCTAIALQKNGLTVSGIVFDPLRKELFVAEKGKGAFLNGKRIMVSKKTELREFICITSIRAGLPGEPWLQRQERFLRLYPLVRSVRMFGASELDLCWLATGRVDAFVHFNVFPWDGAAGALIVREAGGTATDEKGNLWEISKKVLIATNGRRHKEFLGILGL
ncbi:MAG: inositol monophosphatase family protein [Candidatus Diapherotrites archaeon]